MAKTIAEFQQEGGDPSQPKWMRDTAPEPAQPAPQRRAPRQAAPVARPVDVTDEAAMLDAPREKPQKPPRPEISQRPAEPALKQRSPVEPLPQRQPPQPIFMQKAPSQPDKRPTAKLSRQQVEDQTAEAYISPARRKRPNPKPELPAEPEVDLFSSAPPKATTPSTPNAVSSKPSSAPPAPKVPSAPPKPKAQIGRAHV